MNKRWQRKTRVRSDWHCRWARCCFSPFGLLWQKYPQIVWLTNNRNVFITVVEAGSLGSAWQHGWVRNLFQVTDFPLYPHMAAGPGNSLMSFTGALTPPSRPNPLLEASPPNTIPLGLGFQHRDGGGNNTQTMAAGFEASAETHGDVSSLMKHHPSPHCNYWYRNTLLQAVPTRTKHRVSFLTENQELRTREAIVLTAKSKLSVFHFNGLSGRGINWWPASLSSGMAWLLSICFGLDLMQSTDTCLTSLNLTPGLGASWLLCSPLPISRHGSGQFHHLWPQALIFGYLRCIYERNIILISFRIIS